MKNWLTHLRYAGLTGLSLGVGWVIGHVVYHLTIGLGIVDPLLNLFGAGRFIIGLTMLILTVGIIGGIGGGMGGFTLSYAHQQPEKRWGYAWRGALAYGLTYALTLWPLAMFLAFYTAAIMINDPTSGMFVVYLGLMGGLFGGISGLILALLTAPRQLWKIFWVSTLAFMIAGGVFGYGLWAYLIDEGRFKDASWVLYFALFLFGFIGGGAMGGRYSQLAHQPPQQAMGNRLTTWFKQTGWIPRAIFIVAMIVLFLLVRAAWILSPFATNEPNLHHQLYLDIKGIHWYDPLILTTAGETPAIAATTAGEPHTVTVMQSDVYYQPLGNLVINVSNSAAPSSAPQLAVADDGTAHVVWTEQQHIYYSRCFADTCTPPVNLSGETNLSCAPIHATHAAPRLALDDTGQLMVIWRTESDLLYTTWSASAPAPTAAQGCLRAFDTLSHDVAAGTGGNFSLTFGDSQAQIYLLPYSNGNWAISPQRIGEGHQPTILLDDLHQPHVSWCDARQHVAYWYAGQTETLEFPPCVNSPALAISQTETDTIHLVWYSDHVEKVSGALEPQPLLYEAVRYPTGWVEPSIVAHLTQEVQPDVVSSQTGLHLVWADTQVAYQHQPVYTCNPAELPRISQVVYEVIQQGRSYADSDIIPACYNRFEQLIHVPNSKPEYGDNTPIHPNGVFDVQADFARTAQYEVLFANMWYEEGVDEGSPGRVFAHAVADLYANLKANPENYPRGLTVRILLGNPPKYGLMPNLNHQVWSVMRDLKAAGITEMHNEKLGWNLEVANFGGAWPHSHTKLVVVDGVSAMAVGFNMQHPHLPADHPSGKGKGRRDLGLHLTGPVAQAAQRAYDDLWQSSDLIDCPNFEPERSFFWMISCTRKAAQVTHVPEVSRMYLAPENQVAFSLHRTQAFKSSDDAFIAAMRAAESSIDLIQVQFSFPIYCDLNVLFEVCDYRDRPNYVEAFMDAIEQNGVTVRMLLEAEGPEWIESQVGIKILLKEAKKRGLEDLFQVRGYNRYVHSKTVLIDDELVVVGSQNFHYSAWGEGGLTEYNLATTAPEAVAAFKRMFEYEWANGNIIEID